MANYNEESSVKLDFAMPFQRTGKFPLDRSSMFSSLADAVKYAKGDTSDPDSRGLCGSSYIGQQICVYENDEVKLYIIDQDRTLKTTSGSGTLVVTVTGDESPLTADKTFQEIQTALNENKSVICYWAVNDKITNILVPNYKWSNNSICFGSVAGGQEYSIAVQENNYWTVSLVGYITQNDITQTISKESTNEQVPSAKATYDSIKAVNDRLPTPRQEMQILQSEQIGEFEYGWTCGNLPTLNDFINLGITDAAIGDIVTVKYIDDSNIPVAYTTLSIASDDDVNTMITEVLGSYSTQQQPSSIILNSNTTDSTKQFELTIDDTGTLTSQEL